MASESSGTDFGGRVFKFCANVINVVAIPICTLEDQRVTRALKMFTFIYFLKFSIFLQLRITHFFRFYQIFQPFKLRKSSDLSHSTSFKMVKFQLQRIL